MLFPFGVQSSMIMQQWNLGLWSVCGYVDEGIFPSFDLWFTMAMGRTHFGIKLVVFILFCIYEVLIIKKKKCFFPLKNWIPTKSVCLLNTVILGVSLLVTCSSKIFRLHQKLIKYELFGLCLAISISNLGQQSSS